MIEPRQCLFIGTTNRGTYLRDETGGRRFWPIKCGTIDIDALARDRDQLFAEAVALYRDGLKWWPDADFERERHYAATVGAIRSRRVGRQHPRICRPKKRVTVGEVGRHALGFETARIGTADQRRIAAALEQFGWKRQTQSWDGKR